MSDDEQAVVPSGGAGSEPQFEVEEYDTGEGLMPFVVPASGGADGESEAVVPIEGEQTSGGAEGAEVPPESGGAQQAVVLREIYRRSGGAERWCRSVEWSLLGEDPHGYWISPPQQAVVPSGGAGSAVKRACRGTKTDGTPCQKTPQKHTPWCTAHDPAIPAESRFGSFTQASAAGKLGAPTRFPRVRELVEKRLEENAERIVGAGLEALDATKPVVIEESGRDEDGRMFTRQDVREFPDHLVRLKAYEALTARALGRPHQAMSIEQETRQLTLTLDATDPEVRQGLHAFLRTRPPVTA